MNRLHLGLLSTILILIGFSLFIYKLVVLGFPVSQDATSEIWNMEARFTFMAQQEAVKVVMYAPQPIDRFIITDESFIAPGYGITQKIESPNRKVIWTIRKADGVQTLYYQNVIRQLKDWEMEENQSGEVVGQFQTSLPPLEGPLVEAGLALLAEAKEQSADTHTLILNLLHKIQNPGDDSNATLLSKKTSSSVLCAQLLTLNGDQARVVHGVELSRKAQSVEMREWLEFYEKGQWISIDPQTPEEDIPGNYLPWWRGSDELFQLGGGKKLEYRISVSPHIEQGIQGAVARGKIANPSWVKFSLFSLPIEMQIVYHILVLIPVGAFLLVIFRNIIGIKTFGTFMPILIALAFRETQLLWGIVLFSALIALGLGVRFYLDQLNLLLVPRLAAVLIVVVIMMGVLSVVFYHLGIVRGLSVALFPMVIVTMTIERMSIVWDERGPAEAIQQAIGSLTVAALAHLVMSQPIVDHVFFTFPELLLVLLAVTILLGRYSGYRLLELRRFQSLLSRG